jgi:hypothetical protein
VTALIRQHRQEKVAHGGPVSRHSGAKPSDPKGEHPGRATGCLPPAATKERMEVYGPRGASLGRALAP